MNSEPELVYLFKHIVTHEVTYESLPFGLRAQLHEQLARYLERQIDNGTMTEAGLLDTLVFHYSRSENQAKQRLYLQKAGTSSIGCKCICFSRGVFHAAARTPAC